MTHTTRRNARLGQMLVEHRRSMLAGVQSRIRTGRTEGPAGVRDELEQSGDDSQGDIELALLQMRAQTLARIDEAIARLAEGAYGACVECDAEISEKRLQAVPFAVRCQACEARREQVVSPERALRAASRWSYREAAGM